MDIPYVPVMKGNSTAFTVLGSWYDIADPKSRESLRMMLTSVTSQRDRHTGLEELFEKLTEVLD